MNKNGNNDSNKNNIAKNEKVEKKPLLKTDVDSESKKSDKIKTTQIVNEKENSLGKKYSNNYAGFWVRYVAFFIDSVVVALITIPVVVILGIFIAVISVTVDNAIINMILDRASYIVSLFVGLLYYILTTNHYQATLGKMAIGIKVESETGEKLSLKYIILRESLKAIQSMFLLHFLYAIVGFTDKKQALHDLASKSVVVYVDPIKRARKYIVGAVIGLQVTIASLIIAFILFLIIISIAGLN